MLKINYEIYFSLISYSQVSFVDQFRVQADLFNPDGFSSQTLQRVGALSFRLQHLVFELEHALLRVWQKGFLGHHHFLPEAGFGMIFKVWENGLEFLVC